MVRQAIRIQPAMPLHRTVDWIYGEQDDQYSTTSDDVASGPAEQL